MELMEHIIIYQASGVLGDESCQRPKDFFANPTGRMGLDTVCNILLEPLKICKLIEKNYNNPKNISIINYSAIDWQGDPDTGDLKRYLQYTSGRLSHQVQARAKVVFACKETASDKPKRRDDSDPKRRKESEDEIKQYPLLPIFGFPIEISRHFYCSFQRCLCPIYLRFRRLCDVNIKETFQCWCLNLGALPPLALCLMRGCLLFDPDNPIELAFQAGFLSRSGGWHRRSRIYTEEKAKVVIAVWGTELFPIPCRA